MGKSAEAQSGWFVCRFFHYSIQFQLFRFPLFPSPLVSMLCSITPAIS